MKTETEKDEMMRRYLLDEMSDEERGSVEELFLEDDDFFEEITAFEDELFYEYKQNRLSAAQRRTFEEKFLKTPQDRQKAAFAEAFLQAADSFEKEKSAPSLWQQVAAFFNFSNSPLRAGMALASVLLVAVVGIWLLGTANRQDVAIDIPKDDNTNMPTAVPPQVDEKFIREKQKEQEELQKQLEEEKRKNEQNADKIREMESKREKLQREIEENQKRKAAPLPKTPQRTYIALILSPGLINRSGGAAGASRIELTPNIKTLRLSLKSAAPPREYKISVRAIDDDREVWSASVRKTQKKSISINIPAQILGRGDYEISLINTADNEEVESYYFSILK